MINKKNKGLKSIIGIFIVMLFMISFVSAGTINFNQNEVINNYEQIKIGAIMNDHIVGNDNSETLVNKTGDYKIEFSALDTAQYIILNNVEINTTINISWKFKDNDVTTTQELTFEEVGEYYFEISPTYDGESASILFNTDPSSIFLVYFVMTSDNELKSLFSPFITGVVDLIKINLNIWKLFYYLLIGAIMFSVIIGGVLMLVKVYKLISQNKVNMLTGKHNRGNR